MTLIAERNNLIASRFTSRFNRQQSGVFAVDVEVLKAQQRAILANPELRLDAYNIDQGGVRARQIIARLIREGPMAQVFARSDEQVQPDPGCIRRTAGWVRLSRGERSDHVRQGLGVITVPAPAVSAT